MRRLAVLLAILLLAATAARAQSLDHDGVTRTWEVVHPDGLPTPAPVLFVLHGGAGTIARIRRITGLDRDAGRLGMVMVFPQGLANQWNDGRDAPTVRGNQGSRAVDDTGFLRALAARLVADGIADRRRIHVTGLSNGGMMTLRLACAAADVFAAFVPVIANLPEPLAGDTCRPARPVPLLLMNGTADRLILWQGGPVAAMFPGDRGRTVGTDATIARFRALNGCDDRAEVSAASDVGGGVRLTTSRWTGCAGGTEVALYRFDGMGHRWPGAGPGADGPLAGLLGPAPAGFDAGLAIRDFLLRWTLD